MQGRAGGGGGGEGRRGSGAGLLLDGLQGDGAWAAETRREALITLQAALLLYAR